MGSFYRRRFGRRLARPRARPRRRLVLCSRRCLDAKTGQANSRHYGDPCTRRILLVGGRPISTSSRPGWVLLTSEQRYLPGCEIPSRALLAWGGRMPHGEIAQRDDPDQALVVAEFCQETCHSAGHETLSLRVGWGTTLSSLLSHAKRAGAAEAYGSETGRLPVIVHGTASPEPILAGDWPSRHEEAS
jgi:hypothetical protein